MNRRTARRTAAVALLAGAALVLAACGSGPAQNGTDAAPSCPGPVLDVVVTVDQWGDIVQALAGSCADVTTIITGAAGDPHDYELSPGDAVAFTDADLVVRNGLDYDHWADDVLATLPEQPAVVDAGDVAGLTEGANPHLWYDPHVVSAMAGAVTEKLGALAPADAAYFTQQATQWEASMAPYRAGIERIATATGAKTYGATESVFDDMATAIGLTDRTPEGFVRAAANESEPAPGDVHAFMSALAAGDMDVLIYNIQTEGAVPQQIRAAAESAGVPVVEVTETVPDGIDSFVSWQVGQLDALATALGIGA